MKKLIISILALASIAFSANAQIYVGGLAGFDLTAPGSSTAFTFQLSPEVGYNISDKFATGVALNMTPSVDSAQKVSMSTFTWNIQPYARFKFFNIGNLNLFGDAAVALGTTGVSTKIEGITETSNPVFQWSVGFYPGISYNFTQNWSVVTRIAGISYGGSKDANAFNLNVFRRIAIGFYYSF